MNANGIRPHRQKAESTTISQKGSYCRSHEFLKSSPHNAGFFMPFYSMLPPLPRVAIILLNWNDFDESVQCLITLSAMLYPMRDVIVMDNGSRDTSGERLREAFPEF